MKSFALLCRGKAAGHQAKKLIFWNERGTPISIPEKVEEWLLDIRAEHMRWAFETAFLPLSGGEKLQDALTAGNGPSMWWTSPIYERHPRLSPHLHEIYKLRCLERLLLAENCGSLEVIGAEPLLAGVLEELCRAHGIAFASIEPAAPRPGGSLARRLYRSLPAPLRALARFAHWLWTVRRHLPFVGGDWPQKRLPPAENGANDARSATIATYFPNIDLQAAGQGRFLSRYWENLHEALNRRARYERPAGPHFVRWLFIRFPSPQLSFRQCLELRDAFQKNGGDGLSFNYLEEFLAPGDLPRALWRWLAICLASARARKSFSAACHFHGSRLNFWPYMKWEWGESFRGWRCLERCLQNLAFRRHAAMTGAERWRLFPLENCPWERMLTQAARENEKTPVFGAQHSTVRPTDFRYFDDPATFTRPECAIFQPDIVAGNGQSACGQWLANGMPEERLLQVEALRYLYLAGHAQERAIFSDLPPQAGEPLLPPAEKRLLVLTSFFAEETLAHLSLLEKVLASGFLDDWDIAIKPHPYLSVLEWLDSLPEKSRGRIRLAEGALAQEFRPGIIVWASNSTTTALEAALLGLPLLVMPPEGDFDLCPIQNAPGLARPGNVEEVIKCLENPRLTRLPPDYLDLDPRLEAWRKLLRLNFPDE